MVVTTVVAACALPAEPLLFAGLGSVVVDVAEAALVNEPLPGAATVMVTVVVCPLVKLPRLHVTTPELFAPPPVVLTKVTFVGRSSVRTTPVDVPGPILVTVRT